MTTRMKSKNIFASASIAAAASMAMSGMSSAAHDASRALDGLGKAVRQRSYVEIMDERRRDRRDRKRRKKLRRHRKGSSAYANRRRERARIVTDHKRDNPDIYAMANWQNTRFRREVAEFWSARGKDPSPHQIDDMARRWVNTPRREPSFQCDTCMDTGECMTMIGTPNGPSEARCYCPDCGSGEVIYD